MEQQRVETSKANGVAAQQRFKFNPDKLDMKALRRAAAHYEIASTEKMKAKALAYRLDEHFESMGLKEDEFTLCEPADGVPDTSCGAKFPVDYPVDFGCPYCGDGCVGEVKTTGGTLAPTTALAVASPAKLAPAPTSGALAATDRLDQEVREVRDLVARSAVSMWQLGRKLAEVKASENWKERRGDDGKPAYVSFGEFVSAECGIKSSDANELIDVSARFAEDEYARLGRIRSVYLLRMPNSERADELKAKALAGEITTREMKQELAEQKQEVFAQTGKEFARDTGRDVSPNLNRDVKGGVRVGDDGKPKETRITVLSALDKKHTAKARMKEGREWVPATLAEFKKGTAISAKFEGLGTADLFVTAHYNPTTSAIALTATFKRHVDEG